MAHGTLFIYFWYDRHPLIYLSTVIAISFVNIYIGKWIGWFESFYFWKVLLKWFVNLEKSSQPLSRPLSSEVFAMNKEAIIWKNENLSVNLPSCWAMFPDWVETLLTPQQFLASRRSNRESPKVESTKMLNTLHTIAGAFIKHNWKCNNTAYHNHQRPDRTPNTAKISFKIDWFLVLFVVWTSAISWLAVWVAGWLDSLEKYYLATIATALIQFQLSLLWKCNFQISIQ